MRGDVSRRVVTCVLKAVAGLALIGSVAALADAPIRTSVGLVQGFQADGVREYLGIPYAAPPVGALRWQPPRDPVAGTEVLQATKFANFCPATQRGVFASPSVTEDCLYLNVFAPKTAGKRPVMVWFYGGGLYSGESNDYDGSKLARRGDVVVVTLNYRVGVLGFLSHPAVNGEGHPFANYGIMDQQFALRWVRRNIAQFGGDPANVTIFGQSGGATAVMANLVSPTAAGLFQRAINQSGTHIAEYRPADALRAGQDFATAAGCAEQTAACLRSLSVEQVLRSQAPVIKYVIDDFPVVDGTIITHTALDAFRSGAFNHVPIMTGLVRDEQAFFLPEGNSNVPLSAADYERYAASFGSQHAEALLAHYPLSSYPSPSLADIAMAQGFKACTARELDRAWSKYVPVYAYQFNDRTAPSYFRELSYPMRAYHTAELQYLFPMFHGGQGTAHPLNEAQEALSNQMVDDWTSFARRGALPAGVWPRYSLMRDNVEMLDLGGIISTPAYGKANDCALWNSILSAAP